MQHKFGTFSSCRNSSFGREQKVVARNGQNFIFQFFPTCSPLFDSPKGQNKHHNIDISTSKSICNVFYIINYK